MSEVGIGPKDKNVGSLSRHIRSSNIRPKRFLIFRREAPESRRDLADDTAQPGLPWRREQGASTSLLYLSAAALFPGTPGLWTSWLLL